MRTHVAWTETPVRCGAEAPCFRACCCAARCRCFSTRAPADRAHFFQPLLNPRPLDPLGNPPDRSLKRTALRTSAMICASSQVRSQQQRRRPTAAAPQIHRLLLQAIADNTLLCPNRTAQLARADGSQLVAAVGSRVLVYDASDGELQHSLKGHKVRRAHAAGACASDA
jgi:hypothetical protein